MQVVTTHHYILEDVVHLKIHPQSKTHPTLTLVTKALPMALLRTCRQVYFEARSFLEHRLKEEPLRYLFDAPALRTFASVPRRHSFATREGFDIFRVIRQAENT